MRAPQRRKRDRANDMTMVTERSDDERYGKRRNGACVLLDVARCPTCLTDSSTMALQTLHRCSLLTVVGIPGWERHRLGARARQARRKRADEEDTVSRCIALAALRASGT